MCAADILAKREWTLRVIHLKVACVDEPACKEPENHAIRRPCTWFRVRLLYVHVVLNEKYVFATMQWKKFPWT